MANNICYHTRLHDAQHTKVTGGSFGGSIDMETVNRLVKAHFTVQYTNSGRAVFVDKNGRPVSLYITVNPESTEVGKQAWEGQRAQRLEKQRQEEAKEKELKDILDFMTTEQALAILKGE